MHCVQFWGVDSFLLFWGMVGTLTAMVLYLMSALEFNKIFGEDLFAFLDSWDEKARWLLWMANSGNCRHSHATEEVRDRAEQLEHATSRLKHLISPVCVFGIDITPSLQMKAVSVAASLCAAVFPQLVHFIYTRFETWIDGR